MRAKGQSLYTLSTLVVLAAAAAAAFGGLPARAQSADNAAAPVVSYARGADEVVLELSREIGMLADPDPTPFVRVYGDGRVVVHYPFYMKKAGDYSLRLSEPEMQELVLSMVGLGLVEFDAGTARRAKHAAELAARERARRVGEPGLLVVSDDETTVMVLRLERYAPAGEERATYVDLAKEISWFGLRSDVERHPGVDVLGRLYEAERQLAAFAEREDLERAR